MRNMLMGMVMGLVAAAGVAGIVFAADGDGGKVGGLGLGKMGRGGFGRGMFLRRLVGPEDRKAEFDRFKQEREALRTERQALREKIVADIKAGKTRAEAVQAHIDDIKALFTKFLDSVIGHREKLLETAKAHEDGAVNTFCQRLLDRIKQHKARVGAGRHGAKPEAKPEAK